MGPHSPNKLFATKYCFSFSLFLYFSIFFVIILRYHEFLQKSFYYYYFLFFSYFFFHENYFYFFMFRDVPGFSGMFRVPGFNDAPRGKGFNKIFLCHFKWSSNDMARCLEGPKVPRSFSFRIVFFLVITALFCFFI